MFGGYRNVIHRTVMPINTGIPSNSGGCRNTLFYKIVPDAVAYFLINITIIIYIPPITSQFQLATRQSNNNISGRPDSKSIILFVKVKGLRPTIIEISVVGFYHLADTVFSEVQVVCIVCTIALLVVFLAIFDSISTRLLPCSIQRLNTSNTRCVIVVITASSETHWHEGQQH